MLKWTVSQKLQKVDDNIGGGGENCPVTPVRWTRKHVRRSLLRNKENLITSTPLPKVSTSPLPSLINSDEQTFTSPFRDILNITPERSTIPLATNNNNGTRQNLFVPLQYASTLPTFEEEYSPSTILSGPMLAMRGIRVIRNSYFETTELAQRLENQKLQTGLSHAILTDKTNSAISESEATLTQSRISEFSIEKLIDSILDSSRKDRKKRSRRSLNLRRRTILRNSTQEVLSPSYTPGDDPASDLCFSDYHIKTDRKILQLQDNSKREFKKRRSAKKLNSYFEVGIALPSVYV